jgi:hypothetical protein
VNTTPHEYEQIRKSLKEMEPVFRELRNAFEQFVRTIPDWQERIRIATEAIRKTTDRFSGLYQAHRRTVQVFETLGWLPHDTWPKRLTTGEDDLSISEIGEQLEVHYRDQWDTVQSEFSSSFDRLEIDAETRLALGESLQAHRNGHYRAVVRLLFPEIEKEIRTAFYRDALTSHIAGQKEFLDRISRVAFGHVLQREFDLTLYKKLSTHMYQTVNDNNRSLVAADPVPNRHAALHGLVTYASAQNSINTLIMADYILRLITSLKRNQN